MVSLPLVFVYDTFCILYSVSLTLVFVFGFSSVCIWLLFLSYLYLVSFPCKTISRYVICDRDVPRHIPLFACLTFLFSYLSPLSPTPLFIFFLLVTQYKSKKEAKIRYVYNQVPHLTQDTNGKVTNSQLDITNDGQEVR